MDASHDFRSIGIEQREPIISTKLDPAFFSLDSKSFVKSWITNATNRFKQLNRWYLAALRETSKPCW